MALIFFVRHAQASFGAANYDQLSDLGRQQSRWLGEHFAARGLRFQRVVTGALVRQRDTALELLGAMGHDASGIETHDGLDEYRGDELYRCYTGGRDQREHQRSDYRGYWRTFREAMEAWADDRLQGMPESWAEFGARVRAGIDTAVRDAGRDDAVLVVSSGGAIGRAIGEIVGSPAKVAIEFNLQFRNTGYCELLSGGGGLRLLTFNSLPHLEVPDRRHAITFA
jgi:broad specificity phosphatase PhoE